MATTPNPSDLEPPSPTFDSLARGPSTGQIIDNGSLVLLKVIWQTSTTTIYLAYDGSLSSPKNPVFSTVAEHKKSLRFCSPKEFSLYKLRECGDDSQSEYVYCTLDHIPFYAQPPEWNSLLGGKITIFFKLGSGAFGEVWLGHEHHSKSKSKRTPNFIAVKSMNIAEHGSRRRLCQQMEFNIHHHLCSAAKKDDTAGIVKLHRTDHDKDRFYMILDYLPDGDLFEVILRGVYCGGKAKEDLIKSVFMQLADALKFCHDNGMYHRDIKPENILTSHHGQKVYLADFGLATNRARTDEWTTGTTEYLPEEALRECARPFNATLSSKACDCWAMAIILFMLTFGTRPWCEARFEDKAFTAFVKDPYSLRKTHPISKDFVALLSRAFAFNPAGRPSLTAMKKAVRDMDTFYMSPSEIDAAPKACQDNARRIGLAMPARFYRVTPVPALKGATELQLEISSSSSESLIENVPIHAADSSSWSMVAPPAPSTHASEDSESEAEDEGPITPETLPVNVKGTKVTVKGQGVGGEVSVVEVESIPDIAHIMNGTTDLPSEAQPAVEHAAKGTPTFVKPRVILAGQDTVA